MAEFHRCQKVELQRRSDVAIMETTTMLGQTPYTYRVYCSCAAWDSGPCNYIDTAINLLLAHCLDAL